MDGASISPGYGAADEGLNQLRLYYAPQGMSTKLYIKNREIRYYSNLPLVTERL